MGTEMKVVVGQDCTPIFLLRYDIITNLRTDILLDEIVPMLELLPGQGEVIIIGSVEDLVPVETLPIALE